MSGGRTETQVEPELKRHLGLGSAAAVVIGEVIAVGIFLTPAGMAKALGSPLWILAVWLVMGAMAVSGALCFGELAARFPEAGGGYVYLREAFGRQVAFLYGWKCLLVMDPGLTAALGVGAAAYAGRLVELSTGEEKLVAIAFIASAAATNALGFRLGPSVIRVLAALKLALLAFLALWSFGGRLGTWQNFLPFAAQRPGSEPLAGALAGGLVAAFFAFGGWWDLAKLGGEVREPARTLPRALVLGVLAVTLAYVTTSAVFLYLVPIEDVESGVAFAAQAGRALFGAAGEQIFSAIVLLSALGSLAGLVLAAPRVYYAMARDGLFATRVASLHPRFGTPARAIALQALLACLMVSLGTFEQILGYFVFVTALFLALTAAAVLVLRRSRPDAATERIPLYPLPPALFLATVAVLIVLLAAGRPRESLAGVTVVALGLPCYRLVSERRRSESP